MTLLLAYFLGSIPFGLILTRLAGHGDVRAIGSGNIGATNVLRTGNKKLAATVLLLDMGKGYAAVWLATHFGESPHLPLYAAYAVILGHMFPVWLKFKGGKGVATSIGALIALHWLLALAVFTLWLGMMWMLRIVSLASITAALAAPGLAWILAGDWLAISVAPLSLLLLYQHRTNIERLKNGAEPQLGKKP